MTKLKFPFKTHALHVKQRGYHFYIAVLPVELLLQVAASYAVKAEVSKNEDTGYELKGTQRTIKGAQQRSIMNSPRLAEIARYIQRYDATFPNSIILAANHDFDTNLISGAHWDAETDKDSDSIEEKERWTADEIVGDLYIKNASNQNKKYEMVWDASKGSGNLYTLTIPTSKKMASIIDGQHRLLAFANVKPEHRENIDLLCSIFIDLDVPRQAHIFATINSTQKRVDRSLTYELFGYNIDDEPPQQWPPDKLAVYLTRRLAVHEDSPLFGRILIAPRRDETLKGIVKTDDWKVSTAVIVDGILALISSNPKRDSDIMKKGRSRPRDILDSETNDRTPLRDMFIEGNDKRLYAVILNYLMACDKVFWKGKEKTLPIFKTIGVQATLDIMRVLVIKILAEKGEFLLKEEITPTLFEEELEEASKLTFTEKELQNYSDVGRLLIRNAIGDALGLRVKTDRKKNGKDQYRWKNARDFEDSLLNEAE